MEGELSIEHALIDISELKEPECCVRSNSKFVTIYIYIYLYTHRYELFECLLFVTGNRDKVAGVQTGLYKKN